MITSLARTNWKKSFLVALVLAIIVSFLLPHFALAQAGNIVASYAEKFLFEFVNIVFGTMVGIGGSLLNFSINNFVIGFGHIYTTKGLGFAIDSLWVIVRDIFNLTFIFGLVFIGLKMIFESDSGAKKLLVNLILAALFVNFSLFITKFVVDFSNIATVQVVNTFQKDKDGNPDFSGAFADSMGLSSSQKLTTDTFQEKFINGGGLGFIFGQLFIYIIATFVFMGGALLLMIRFVVLNLYMLLSPLMFLGLVFPSAAGISKEYWKGFIGRAFFAPAYILMLYFSLKIMTSYKLILPPGQTGLAEVFTKPLELGSVLPPFILTSIFLIASLVIAQKMSAHGGSAIISAQNAMMGKIRSGVKGTSMKIGSAATYPARSLARMGVNATGTRALKGFNTLQANRQTAANQPGAGWITRKAAAAVSANAVDRAARGVTQGLAGAKLGTGTTNQAEMEYKKKTQANISQTMAANERARNLEALVGAGGALGDISKTAAELTQDLIDLGKIVKSMTKEEKEAMNITRLTDKNIAVHLSDGDIENLEKSGKFNNQQVQQIKDARKHAFTSIATHKTTHTTTDAKGVVTGFPVPNAAAINQRGDLAVRGAKEVGKMPIEVFKEKDMYAHITPAMVEERIRNGVSDADRQLIRDALYSYYSIPAGSTPKSTPAIATNNPWRKWEDSNSTYAAQFFA